GKWFQEAIEHANEKQLSGQHLVAYLKNVSPTVIEPHKQHLDFHQNITAEDEEETANVENVLSTMNELMKTTTIVKGAVMPDACPTGGIGQIPVGGVVAAKNAIHPAMHSADICCSVMMTNFGHVSPKTVLDFAHAVTHFGGGGRDDFSKLPTELEEKLPEKRCLNDERSLNM